MMLPINSTTLEKAIIKAFENVLNDKDLLIKKLWHADHCPDEFLPYLASFLSVDFSAYNKVDNDKKRLMIKTSIDIHRRKGTLGALKRALETIDYEISLREWYQYNGKPHTFTLDVMVKDDNKINKDLPSIKHLIDTNKNVQSAYQFNLINPLTLAIVSGGASQTKHIVNLKGAMHV